MPTDSKGLNVGVDEAAKAKAEALREYQEIYRIYPNPITADKIKLLEERIAADKQQADAILRGASGNPALAVLLGTVQLDSLTAKQQLVQAQQVELPSVLTHGAATKTTARSRRNDVVVAAFLGFVLGLIAALAWEPIASRRK